jgi:hypothetical protein
MTTVRRKGTFRAQHAEKTGRAAQRSVLPPRCTECRLPGVFVINGEPRCAEHRRSCACPHGDDSPAHNHWTKCPRE